MEYIESLADRDEKGCFLCAACQTPERDAERYVLRRSPNLLAILNRFPYNSGHLLVAPTAHVGRLEELDQQVLTELMLWIRDAQRVLEIALQPQGFNVGMNIGHCAGAGLPEHLHWHIVPRWAGDTNFMPVIGDVKVIPQELRRTYQKLQGAARQLGW